VAGAVLLSLSTDALSGGVSLKSIDFGTASNGNLRVEMAFDGPAPQPRLFQTDNPARIAIDFPGVRNGLVQKNIPVNLRGAESIQVIESGGRTRAVLNLVGMAPYTGSVQGNRFILAVQTGMEPLRAAAPPPPRQSSRDVLRIPAQPVRQETLPYRPTRTGGARVESIDFRRGERGEGRVIVALSDAQSVVDVRRQGEKIVVMLPGVSLSPQVARRYDVLDFGTPVRLIETSADGMSGSRLEVTPTSQAYDYSSYQTDRLLTVELRPLTRAELEQSRQDRAGKYSGERLSLNFQDIPVRSVLQILADFTNLNIVASDSVQGNVTLRLNEVPWDQALDLVLKSRGLAKRQDGNIIRVAPTEEITRIEREELEAHKAVEELEPLRMQVFVLNYANARAVKDVLEGGTTAESKKNVMDDRVNAMTGERLAGKFGFENAGGGASTGAPNTRLLSGRGAVTIDQRTNQLVILDTPSSLEEIGKLIRKLDIPVRQVLIESRIVIADTTFLRSLGAKIGFNRVVPGVPQTQRGYLVPTEGVLPVDSTQGATYGDMLVDLGTAAASAYGGSAGFTLLKAGDYLLDLELSAAQRNARTELISNPRVVTADKEEATISQGVQIPYQITQQGTGGGVPVQNVAFKDAVLELKVTPLITPDDNIQMKLAIKKDVPGEVQSNGNRAIETRRVDTNALVMDGETIVLGGVFESDDVYQVDKVPFFGDLPGVGFFFRRDSTEERKRELLFFITPKLLKDSFRNAVGLK
jgi:type IV pilus assembly protein PilQ